MTDLLHRSTPLPVRINPAPDETLVSVITRAAHLLGVTADALLTTTGVQLHRVARSRRMAVANGVLTPADIERLAVSLRIDADGVRDLLFADLLHRVRGGRVWGPSMEHLVLRNASAPVCPQCIDETGGVRFRRWRAVQSFACPTHRTLLVSSCHACRSALPVWSPVHATDPMTCGAFTGGPIHRQRFCTADLRSARRDDVAEGSVLLETATYVQRLLTEADPDTARDQLSDLRAITTGLLQACTPKQIAQRAGVSPNHIEGLALSGGYPVLSPSDDVLWVGVVLGAADQMLRHPDRDARRELLRPLVRLADPAPILDRKDSTVRLWDAHTERFDEMLLHTLDGDLSAIDRLRFGSATGDVERPSADTDKSAVARSAVTPRLAWPELTFLFADAGLPELMLRQTLSVALTLVGQADPRAAIAAARLGGHLARAPSFDLNMLGSGTRQSAALSLLAQIARQLPTMKPTVNYERRRFFDYGTLLAPASWRVFWPCVATTNREDTRRSARLFLSRRLSGDAYPSGIAELPTQGGYDQFLLGMTQRRLDLLDSYARQAIPAPNASIVWYPQLDATSMLIDTVDSFDRTAFDTALSRGAPSIGALASETGLTPVRVRMLLECRPPGPAATSQVDAKTWNVPRLRSLPGSGH